MVSLDRRTFINGLVAAPFVSRTALGQNAGEIVMANFGGGVAEAFNEAYGKPFTAETGIKFRVQEVPSTETALISSASKQQYNSSYHSYSGAMRLYKMGIIEPLAIDDFPALQDIPREYLPMADAKHVVGVPCHFAFYGIAFNSDEAKASDFKTWKSLSSDKWKDKVTCTSPVFASLYDVPWYSKIFGGDQKNLDVGIGQYKAVAKNALTTYNSMAQNQQLLQRGDAVACAYYSSRIVDLKTSGVQNVNVTIPEEGALMIPYVLVVPKNCPFPEAARKFVNYGGTAPPVERGLAKTGSLPLTTKAKIPDEFLRQNFGMTMADIKSRVFNPDWSFIQEQRDGVIERLQRELGSGK